MSKEFIDGEELGADNHRPSSESPPSLTFKEVCAYLGTSKNKLTYMIEKGHLTKYKNPITGRVLFKIADVERLYQSLTTYKRV
jgi:excisionase family DNA binding protein